jgi:hypothetical protein
MGGGFTKVQGFGIFYKFINFLSEGKAMNRVLKAGLRKLH